MQISDEEINKIKEKQRNIAKEAGSIVNMVDPKEAFKHYIGGASRTSFSFAGFITLCLGAKKMLKVETTSGTVTATPLVANFEAIIFERETLFASLKNKFFKKFKRLNKFISKKEYVLIPAHCIKRITFDNE